MPRRMMVPGLFGNALLSPMGLDPFLTFRREMDRLFDDALRSVGSSPAQTNGAAAGGNVMAPRIDVSDTDNDVRVYVELPGVSQEDVEVSLANDVLSISGQKRIARGETKENFYVVERSFGAFARSIRLPFPVDPDQVQASFDNGVLTVNLPKPQQQQRSARIQINVGDREAGRPPSGGSGPGLGQAAEAMQSLNAADPSGSVPPARKAAKGRAKKTAPSA